MKEISTISLERMNNGAHFLYVSNILTRAETDAKVKTKVAAQVATVTQEDKDLKISQKNLLTDELPKQTPSAMPFTEVTRKQLWASSTSPSKPLRKLPKVLNQQIKDYAINSKMQLDREMELLMNLSFVVYI